MNLLATSGDHVVLGNEAIVRGALEEGVAFASGYPGTPSSEITDAFARVHEERRIAFEYSVNEKVALEMAFAASLAGARAICTMKHLGLMYAGDPLSTIPYVGAVAGLVIVSAADPSCRTSPNEQDQRHLGPMLHVPILDPSTPQEALDMTRFAFELSEHSHLPVILRPTTRLCHTRGPVHFGPLGSPSVAGFRRNPRRFVPIPDNARRLRLELPERLERARELIEGARLLQQRGSGRQAVFAAGVPAATVAAILDEHALLDRVSLITLGAVHPLPEAQIKRALSGITRVLVVEELSPYLEDALRALCSRYDLRIDVRGKRSGHLPEAFEYEPEVIVRGLRAGLDLDLPDVATEATEPVVARPPVLCASCPHRSTYFAARAAFGEESLYFNDIGCYTLGYGPPLETADALLCMGAGVTLAAGVSRVTGQRTVGFLGDSTFFHSGMPALLNAVKENANVVVVVLDNSVTAMTGFQESPGVDAASGSLERTVSIPEVVRALGVRDVAVVDPSELGPTIAAFERARDASGVSVIVAQSPCPIFRGKVEGVESVGSYEVDAELCLTCGREHCGTRCDQSSTPAFARQTARARALNGEPSRCVPIAPCAEACPLGLCVQGYAAHIASGRDGEALELITSRLALPDSVCRVCHRPCEAVCVRAGVDTAVAINDLKRFVADQAAALGVDVGPAREPLHGARVAVVGAGPAGLAAAHELAVRGYTVDVFDAADEPGGLLRTGIPDYRLPPEALTRDIARIFTGEVRFKGGMRLGRDITLDELLARGVDAVFLATGAHVGIRLELEACPDAPPVIDALTWLEDVNSGQRVDANGYVVVIGGGNSAVDAARTARRLGSMHVVMACVEPRDAMPALAEEVEAAEHEGIEIRPWLTPTALRSGGVEFESADGSGNKSFLAADSVIAAIGQATDRSILARFDLALAWTAGGRLDVDRETLRTAHPRIWAGGDLASSAGTVTDAMAAGQRAAWSIDRVVRGVEVADRRMPAPLVEKVAWSDTPRAASQLDEAAARSEAKRCMMCGLCGNCGACIDTFGCPAFYRTNGSIAIDARLCTACGVCAEFCPNGAIHPRMDAPEAEAAT